MLELNTLATEPSMMAPELSSAAPTASFEATTVALEDEHRRSGELGGSALDLVDSCVMGTAASAMSNVVAASRAWLLPLVPWMLPPPENDHL